jgi:acyl-coenzyme A thioesterase PaaI-like protein
VPNTLGALRRRRSEEDETAVSEQARTFERVRKSFAKQGRMVLLWAEVSEVGEGRCVIDVPYGEKLTQQQRYFHGAVAGAIGDSAGGYAALTLAPEGREVLTVEYKINFLAPV